MSEPVSVVRYFPWEGGAVFVGTAGEFPTHVHQAIQICFRFEGRIKLRPSDADPWNEFDVGVVPSRQRHGMDGSRVHPGATIFVEPETREGRALAARFGVHGIAEAGRAGIADSVAALRAAVRERRGRDAIVEHARRIVRALTEHAEPSIASDGRILRAVRYINEHLSAPLTLAQVARVAHLSPSRFRHLFVEQTGMTLRQYVLWRRFVSVWEHRMNGASLSTAAHAAGFADSAHLTRTSRRMIGIAPSGLEIAEAPSRLEIAEAPPG